MGSDHMICDDDTTEETPLQELLSSNSPDESNVFGEQQVNPRIGEEFQVEIPPMLAGSEYIQLLMNPFDPNVVTDVSHSFLIGLPIPIVLLDEEKDDGNDTVNKEKSLKYQRRKKSQISIGRKCSKISPLESDVELNCRKESNSSNIETVGKANAAQLHKSISYSLVPGTQRVPWTDAEKDVFLLGLYIFCKNFFQIKLFLGNKEMGDILSFYYGKFYRCKEYLRWLDCRKPRSRKCVYGRKLLTGWRQQELLARLLPHTPETSRNTLLEDSKSYAEGRISIETYVLSMKAIVGVHALVECVGIGKGKADLTNLAMEPVRVNQVFASSPAVPTSKACSALTSSDIISLLTGDFRLSKARCNDIFWEAVWPRLLARGWHSEQPKDQGYIGSKDYLVFLMPGVKKFSRKKLVKGDHYFDSVSDILNKVVSEPHLLDLEADAEVKVNNCSDWIQEDPSDQEDSSNHRTVYLQPRVPNHKPERMKFVVVDSSLFYGGKTSQIREMRHLPEEFKVVSKQSRRKNEENLFEKIVEEYQQNAATNVKSNAEKKIRHVEPKKRTFDAVDPMSMKFVVVDTSSIDGGKLSKVRTLRYSPDMKFFSRENTADSSDDSLNKHEPDAVETPMNIEPDASASQSNGNGASLNDKAHTSGTTNGHPDGKISKPAKNKHHHSRRSKNDDNLAPLVKRRRLTACAKTEKTRMQNILVTFKSKEVASCQVLSSPDAVNKDMTSSSAEVSPKEKSNTNIIETFDGKTAKQLKKPTIDLNMSQNPPDTEHKMEVEDSKSRNSNSDAMEVEDNTSTHQQQKQSSENLRRQSTRNRPLTTKALEALECGFFKSKREQKSKEVHIPFSAPSRRARSRLKVTSKCGNAGESSGGVLELKKDKDAADQVKESLVVKDDNVCERPDTN